MISRIFVAGSLFRYGCNAAVRLVLAGGLGIEVDVSGASEHLLPYPAKNDPKVFLVLKLDRRRGSGRKGSEEILVMRIVMLQTLSQPVLV